MNDAPDDAESGGLSDSDSYATTEADQPVNDADNQHRNNCAINFDGNSEVIEVKKSSNCITNL